MSLPAININTTNVGAEIGSSSHIVSVLVKNPSLNKWSFYAPGFLSVDANKNVVLTPPTTAYKLGDFRYYDHDANHPIPYNQGTGTHNWTTGSNPISFNEVWVPYQFNVKEVSGYDNYFTVKYYDTSANRAAETSVRHTQTFSISYNGITPLSGHTRDTSSQIDSAQPYIITGFNTAGLGSTCYSETYISDDAGNRAVNLGNRADGYSTISFTSVVNATPYITWASQDITPRPSGYSHIFPRTNNAATPVCTFANVNQTQGSTSYSVYVKAFGISTSAPNNRIVEVLDCSVMMTYGGVTFRIYTGALDYTSSTQITGTLPNSSTWDYNDVATITIVNTRFDTTPNYTAC